MTSAHPLFFLLDGHPDAERMARLRELRALALLLLGLDHPATVVLAEAVADPAATGRALAELDALPALRRRRLLASFGALEMPRVLKAGRGGDPRAAARARRDAALRDLARLIDADSLEDRAREIMRRAGRYRPAAQDGSAERRLLREIADTGLGVPKPRRLRQILKG